MDPLRPVATSPAQARFTCPPGLTAEPPADPADVVVLGASPPPVASLPEPPKGATGRRWMAGVGLGLVGVGLLGGVTAHTLRTAPICPPTVQLGQACVDPEASKLVNQAHRVLQGAVHFDDAVDDLSASQSRRLTPNQTTREPALPEGQLRVITWNLHHGDSPDRFGARSQIEQMQQTLRDRPAEVVFLQEVSPWHAQDLVDSTGMVGYYSQTQWMQGNLILVHPSLGVEDNLKTVVNLPDPQGDHEQGMRLARDYTLGGTEPRQVQVLRLRLPDQSSLVVWNTHLMNGDDDAATRLSQAQATYAAVESLARPGEAVVGGGDFNSQTQSAPMQALRELGYDLSGARIDHLAERNLAGPIEVQVEDLTDSQGVPLSDHPLVSGQVLLDPPKG